MDEGGRPQSGAILPVVLRGVCSIPATSAVDRHADGARADQLALIYDSPVTGVIQRFTYRELRDQVARVAGYCEVSASAKAIGS